MKLRMATLALALLTSTACTATEDPVVQRAGGTVMVAAAAEPDVYMLAAFEGILTRNDRGCLSRGTEVLQLPFGSQLAGDGGSVTVPGHGVIGLGDQWRGGGGHGGLDGLRELPIECEGATGVTYWQ